MFEIEVKQQTGLITWNHEALKKELSERLQRYQGLVVTEDAIKEAKDTRASLNKVTKAIDDERKRIKKLYCGPLEIFENQAKELTGLVTNIIGEIDAQVKYFEDLEKTGKRNQICEYFTELRFHLVPLDKLFDEKWLNKTVTEKQWKEQLSGKVEGIKADLAVIDKMADEDKESIKIFYLDCLNLNIAIQHQESKKERQRALEAHQQANKVEPKQTPTVERETAPVPQNEPTKEVEILRRELWCEGTREDIIAVGEFMKSRGMRFGKLED